MSSSALGDFFSTVGGHLLSLDQKRIEQQQELDSFEKKQRILMQLKDEQEADEPATWSYDPETKMQFGYNKKGKKVASRVATGSEVEGYTNKQLKDKADLEGVQALTKYHTTEADLAPGKADLEALRISEEGRHNRAMEDIGQQNADTKERGPPGVMDRASKGYYEDARKRGDALMELLGAGIPNKITGDYTPIELDTSGVGNGEDRKTLLETYRKQAINLRERLESANSPQEIKDIYNKLENLYSDLLSDHHEITRNKYSSMGNSSGK